MTDIARLVELIEPEAAALGFELVRVQMMESEAGDGGQALQIMAEDPATGQLVIEQCAQLSRRISAVIDEREEAGEVLIEGAYHLEVSSPGIDRPLTREKDFVNWAGYRAKIRLTEKVDGRRTFDVMLIEALAKEGDLLVYYADRVADEDYLEPADRDRDESKYVLLSNIHSAKLVLTDALIAATRPIDTTGAEDIVEETEEEKADD